MIIGGHGLIQKPVFHCWQAVVCIFLRWTINVKQTNMIIFTEQLKMIHTAMSVPWVFCGFHDHPVYTTAGDISI